MTTEAVPHEGETTVKIGLMLPLFSGDTDRVLSFARRAEELGFDGLFAFDHMFPPGAPPDRPSIRAFSTLGAVAAVTPSRGSGRSSPVRRCGAPVCSRSSSPRSTPRAVAA